MDVRAEALASTTGVLTRNEVLGGSGNDTMTAHVRDSLSGDARTISNLIRGGTGDAIVTVRVDNAIPTASHTADVVALGGAGNDSVDVALALNADFGGSTTQATLKGGAGGDVLDVAVTVPGGVPAVAVLPGGGGNDRLNIHGGSAPLADAGAPGLADDLDALALVVDDGTDVTVTLAGGTVIRFAGLGTGTVAGFADLVDDPAAQLVSDPGLAAALLA